MLNAYTGTGSPLQKHTFSFTFSLALAFLQPPYPQQAIYMWFDMAFMLSLSSLANT